MTPEARAARERKQKIFVAVGGLFLLALLAFQLPKLLGGSGSSAAPASETTTVGGETVPGAQSPSVPVVLVDTDPRLTPGTGQIGSFTAFKPKDPFVQQVAERSPVSQPSGGGSKPASKPATTGFTGRSVGAAKATIVAVNGKRLVLEPGATFPSANPVFVLVSEQPKKKTVVVGIPSGRYANGAKTTKLQAGKPLVLVNTKSRKRYRLVLVAVGGGKRATGKKR
jgi:hypothetical protein